MLTICLVSCQSAPIASYDPIHPELPVAPIERPVIWSQSNGGLFLPYNEYRKLAENIIEMRGYIENLKLTIKFYNPEAFKSE